MASRQLTRGIFTFLNVILIVSITCFACYDEPNGSEEPRFIWCGWHWFFNTANSINMYYVTQFYKWLNIGTFCIYHTQYYTAEIVCIIHCFTFWFLKLNFTFIMSLNLFFCLAYKNFRQTVKIWFVNLQVPDLCSNNY